MSHQEETITEPVADRLATKLYELGFTAPGPVLHIADGRHGSLDIVARGVAEAGRRYPVVACSREAEKQQDGHAIHIGGTPASELRALPLRFGAVVICAASAGGCVDDELDALAGKLMHGASVIVLLPEHDEGPSGSHGELELVERVAGAMVMQERPHERDRTRHASRVGRSETINRRRSWLAGVEHRRRRRDIDDRRVPHVRGMLGQRLVGDIETLGHRVTRSEAAQTALARELTLIRSHHKDAVGGLPVTVVIAVHNAYDGLRRCFDSVLAQTPEPHEVLLINDASTDERVAVLLDEYAGRSSRVTVLTNSQNRGYTATINLGCRWAGGDVVLLNSDTEVPSGWLDGLRSVAGARRDVATVTPVSNAAGAFSVPQANVDSELPSGIGVRGMAALVARLSPRHRPRTPTGNGFCMYIRREALDLVGTFDEESFPRGYGEENDFSQRAEAAGFVNLIDDATFVYHTRSASFGTNKAELLAAAKERLREKHPQYPSAVKQFLADDPLRELRGELASALDRGPAEVEGLTDSRQAVLFVLHAGEGGTPATNRDLARSLSPSFRCLTLACDVDHWTLVETRADGDAQLDRIGFADRWALREPLDEERSAALRAIVERENVALVHVRSLIATGPELMAVVKRLGVPLVCSLHDFYTVCPTIQLLDERERFCAGHCTPGGGACPTSTHWVGEQPDLKHGYVHRWRERMAEQLDGADAFVTTSDAAKEVLVDHFRFIDDGRLRIIEHGRDAHGFHAVGEPPGERPRVVAFGALGISKGVTLLEALLEIDRREGPNFEFHFLGPHHRRLAPEALGGIDHGPYRRGELPARLAEIRPSYALITSIWPETYCHALTEAWMADLPVFASDIGTLRERIGRHGGGWLLDHTDPAAFYAGMLEVRGRVGEWHLRRAEIARIEPRTVDDMAADYRALYRELLPARAGA